MPVPCCGPKLSMCGVLLSIWGVVMLQSGFGCCIGNMFCGAMGYADDDISYFWLPQSEGLLGVFFRVRAVGLFEDLPFDEKKWEEQDYNYKYIEDLYTQTSTNCFIATGIYGGLFIFSLIMWNVNKRVDYNMS